MSTVYSDSARGVTTGVPLNTSFLLDDRYMYRLTYYSKMESPAVTGLIKLVVKWDDRDGSRQTFVSPGLPAVLTSDRDQGVVPIWSGDASGQGVYFSYEFATVSVLGSFSFEYFLELDQILQGV